MYENDPNRPNRPPVGEPVGESNMAGIIGVAAVAALIVALGMIFWPSGRPTTVTENTPRVEKTTPNPATKPPANQPTTPAPDAPK
jgi:hypothetical protein